MLGSSSRARAREGTRGPGGAFETKERDVQVYTRVDNTTTGPMRKISVAGRASVYEAIKSAILRGDLPPESPLVEQTLAAQFSVSRTPIREALGRLEQDGLALRTADGLCVRKRSVSEILDIYDAIVVLEARASAVAAERRTEHDLHVLDRILQLAPSVDATKLEDMAEYNREFHRAVWIASHNDALLDLLDRLETHRGNYTRTTLSFPGRWAESLIEHESLVVAIRNRDSERASAIASQHFTTAREIRLTLFYESAGEN